MSGRRIRRSAALIGAAVVGSVSTVAVWGRTTTSASTSPSPSVSTATIARTDLVTTTLTEGTLGYASSSPVVNRTTGTYTWLPGPGSTIDPGQVLYRVDDLPVVLMAGATPAWRSFGPGMSDGPDVDELQSNLIAIGDARGLFSTPNAHFSSLTAEAVDRWQASNGLATDGQIPLGELVFLPVRVLVGAESVAPGQPASPGDTPYQVSTTTRTVTVPLNPNLPTVTVGEHVSIVLPTNATTPGTVTAEGSAPPTVTGGTTGPSAGSGSTSSSSQPQASAVLTVIPDDPAATGTGAGVAVQVSLTTRSVTGVLAAPITALLALAGGGYGVDVVGPGGTHRLVGVTTGIFTGSQVQVSGADIHAGTRVVVAQ